MNEETIVAIFDSAAHAQSAVADLKAAHVPDGAINVHGADADASGSTTTAAPEREQGFWTNVFGGEPDHDTSVYDRSLSSGSVVVTVRTPGEHVTQVMQILESHNPVDIDERAAGYGLAQTTTTTQQPLAAPKQATSTTQASGTGDTIQLAEEQLAVGKRLVNRGGTRIRRFVVETPVEQDVSLHDERVMVERRPVTDGRPLSEDHFGEKTIEMTASAEEAVVSKTARVVEEVGLRKEATDRTETVRDTVRKEDIEVEQIPGTGTTTSGTTMNPRTPKS